MASKRQIFVGGVPIGGGAPVAVQTMTKTETANLAATMEQIRKVADAGADIVRVAVPRDDDVEALKTIVKESPIPVIADIHFNHTLALKAIDAGAHCIRLNPGNIGGREKVAEVAERATAAEVPMRIGVNSGSLPKHLHELERESAGRGAGRRRGRVRRADGVPRLRELQGLDQVDQRAQHDRRQPPARREDPLPAAPGDHRGGDQVVGLAQVLGRPRHPARRRHRRHDPDQPLDLPRRGGGQGRLGDPQGAAAARARPGADRLPDLRPPAVRHGLGRRRDRAAPGRLRRADRGRGARLRGERHRRGQPRRLRHRRRQERGPDLRRTASRCARSRRRRSSTPSSRRSTSRSTAARSSSTRTSRARARPGWRRSRRKTPAN